MKVHDRNNEQNIAPHLTNNSVGEPVGSAAACTPRDRRPSFGELKDPLDGAFYLFGELGAESLISGLVIGNGLNELGLGGGEKLDYHYGLDPPAASKASSAETASISPRSNASIRSSASAAHIPSIRPPGDASRLVSRRSASSARSSGGSDKASSRTSAPLFDMSHPPLGNCSTSLQNPNKHLQPPNGVTTRWWYHLRERGVPRGAQ